MNDTNRFEEIDKNKRIFDYPCVMDGVTLYSYLDAIYERYGNMSIEFPVQTENGAGVPVVSLGNGKKKIVYFSREADKCASVLMRFINEFCEIKNVGRIVYNVNPSTILMTRTLSFFPLIENASIDDVLPYFGGEVQMAVEISHGEKSVEYGTQPLCRAYAEKIGRIYGYGKCKVRQCDSGCDIKLPYCRINIDGEGDDLFHTYAGIRETLFLSSILV